MKANSSLFLATMAALPLAITSVMASAQSYEMVIATQMPEDLRNNEIYPALMHFKNLVEARTEGDLEVTLFGGGQLGSEVENGSEVQGGRTLQSTVLSAGAMSSFYGDYQAVTAPFLFTSWLQAWHFFDSEWFADFMSGTVAATNMRYLGTFDDGGGFVAFTNNKRLIETMEDLEGLNIRTEENPAHVAIMRALGASATPLPWGELITALETGLVDGQFNAPLLNTTFNFDAVTDYTTLTGHVYNSAPWLVNEEWYQSLPEAYRQILISSAREAIQLSHGMSGALSSQAWVESCERFEACYLMPDSERERMAEVARPAWQDWIVNDFGMDEARVQSLLDEVDRIGQQLAADDMRIYGQ